MALVLFDLDNTLILGDSAQAFAEFIASGHWVVNPEAFMARNNAYMREYDEGHLDIYAYMAHNLAPFKGRTPVELDKIVQVYLREVIEPMILPQGLALIQDHQKRNDQLLLVSATGAHLVGPIAQRLGFQDYLAIDLMMDVGCISGGIAGVPSFREGKVIRTKEWIASRGLGFSGSYFYSDSHNDLPLLDCVDHPVVVDPDPILLATAKARGWKQISLRDRLPSR